MKVFKYPISLKVFKVPFKKCLINSSQTGIAMNSSYYSFSSYSKILYPSLNKTYRGLKNFSLSSKKMTECPFQSSFLC